PYWDWLLARGACDRIYIAATQANAGDIETLHDSIVGYAAVRQCRIVEVVTAPGRDEALDALVARICADASEQDDWRIRCDAPPEHPLHHLWQRAGGEFTCGAAAGEVFMARLFDPLAVLRQMAELLSSRARAAEIPRPVELGVELRSRPRDASDSRGGVIERYRILLGQRT